MSYDPDLRRETPLAAKLTARVRREGPITVATYMDHCLNDPEHGYYRSRSAIGKGGDFVTAPEISQAFGELIGLWAAVAWRMMGAPQPFTLVELGPGRGTMMADALRAARRIPGFSAAVRACLVEPSPVLAAIQRATLAGAPETLHWACHVSDVAAGPTILLANEVLDVLPITQFVWRDGNWCERCVGLDDADRLAYVMRPAPLKAASYAHAKGNSPGDVYEVRELSTLAAELALLAASPFVGLLIDYGHAESAVGETLQAVRAHRFEHPLTSPGEADLTAHVDFAAATAALTGARIVAERLVTQGELLGSLGITERASRLMAANPARSGEIEMAVARLMAPQGMGTRFKAMALKSPGLPTLPGF